MARTPLFSRLTRLLSGPPTSVPVAVARHVDGSTRRDFLARAAATAAVPLAHALRPGSTSPRVAIVGAGLAGLTCADRLQSRGLIATVYEARPRGGGRCRSVRGVFPGQVAEHGGEFIDNLHKTMLGYARRFGLALEDVTKSPGEDTFVIDGVTYAEADVVAEYRVLAPRLRADLKTSSGAPTAFDHTDGDVALDHLDLATYLDSRAGDLPLIRKVLTVAYEGEYGLDASEQSCLNLLLFIHADRRSKFQPFGVFSDERYHVVGGNDLVVQGLLADFAGTVEYGRALCGVRRNALGAYELSFADGAPATADAVVLAIPFSVLRHLDLDPSLGLSAAKRHAIDTLGYGTNAKTMIGFEGVPWLDLHHANGTAITNLPSVQNTWETNPSRHGAHAILTDFAAGTRGRLLSTGPSEVQTQVAALLADLESAWPGVSARATRDGQYVLTTVAHWPSSPWALGSYTCYKPGQFTSIAGLEGQRAGHLHFAGEHADSFYSWQGFMEGACLSGLAVADAILADAKKGRI